MPSESAEPTEIEIFRAKNFLNGCKKLKEDRIKLLQLQCQTDSESRKEMDTQLCTLTEIQNALDCITKLDTMYNKLFKGMLSIINDKKQQS